MRDEFNKIEAPKDMKEYYDKYKGKIEITAAGSVQKALADIKKLSLR